MTLPTPGSRGGNQTWSHRLHVCFKGRCSVAHGRRTATNTYERCDHESIWRHFSYSISFIVTDFWFTSCCVVVSTLLESHHFAFQGLTRGFRCFCFFGTRSEKKFGFSFLRSPLCLERMEHGRITSGTLIRDVFDLQWITSEY